MVDASVSRQSSANSQAMMNHGIWRGRFQTVNGQSCLIDSYHQSPLKIAKPFQGDRGEIILYMMDTSPGIFNGDIQEIDCTLDHGVHVMLTNQSSCKLQPSSKQNESRQTIRFRVGTNAVLEYLPEPVVPFGGSNFTSITKIEIEPSGQLILCDILTPGRVARGELFQYHSYRSEITISYDQLPIVFDCIHLQPEINPACIDGLKNYTHIGTLYVVSEMITDAVAQKLRDLITAENTSTIYAGISLLPAAGLIIRVLGCTTWVVQQFLTDCWGILREHVLGLEIFRFRK